MTTETHTCWTVRCDACGDTLGNYLDYEPHFEAGPDGERNLREFLQDCEWSERDGLHRCEDCGPFPDTPDGSNFRGPNHKDVG